MHVNKLGLLHITQFSSPPIGCRVLHAQVWTVTLLLQSCCMPLATPSSVLYFTPMPPPSFFLFFFTRVLALSGGGGVLVRHNLFVFLLRCTNLTAVQMLLAWAPSEEVVSSSRSQLLMGWLIPEQTLSARQRRTTCWPQLLLPMTPRSSL